jgi:hypothetical protein
MLAKIKQFPEITKYIGEFILVLILKFVVDDFSCYVLIHSDRAYLDTYGESIGRNRCDSCSVSLVADSPYDVSGNFLYFLSAGNFLAESEIDFERNGLAHN